MVTATSNLLAANLLAADSMVLCLLLFA